MSESDLILKNDFDVEFLLIETSHPGNIGAVARGIKNMGFKNLTLVNPRSFPDNEAVFRAKGAKDILEKAKIKKNLSLALEESTLIFGTSARTRTIPWPTKSSSELNLLLKKSLKSKNSKISLKALKYC